MVKKEFTERIPKEYNGKSDVDLIELLSKPGTLTIWQRDSIKAILNMRNKRVNQYLTELIQKANRLTGTQNWIMIILTTSILILTGVMVWLGLK